MPAAHHHLTTCCVIRKRSGLARRGGSEAHQTPRPKAQRKLRPLHGSGPDQRGTTGLWPLTWPMVTGTVYYSLPKAGRLAIDLQRTYYIEQIVIGNNFQANLLTIRWTRDF